jgi:hypothetical protein
MLLDKESMFSVDQSLAVIAGTTLSDKSIDVGAAGTIPAAFQARGTAPRDIGKGKPVLVLVEVTEEFDSAGDDTTLKAELITADDDALTSNVVSIGISPAIAQAALLKGYQFMVPGVIPPGTGADRYIGLRYTTGTSTATAGKVNAGLVMDKQTAGTL